MTRPALPIPMSARHRPAPTGPGATALALRAGLRAWLLAPLLAVLLCAAPAHAHKASDAYLQWQVDGNTVAERLDIALRDLDRDLDLDADGDGRLTWGEVRNRWPDLQALATASVQLRSAAAAGADRPATEPAACTATFTGSPALDEHSDGRYAVLTRQWQCPGVAGAPLALAVRYELFARTDPTHRGIARLAQAGGGTRTAVFGPDTAQQTFETSAVTGSAAAGTAAAPTQGLVAFVVEGVHHILIGTDHILFLLALLLPSVLVLQPAAQARRWGGWARWQPGGDARTMAVEVLKVVTAFTVAHSITLALAVLGVLEPPSRWVESIIAASVVFAAINNLVPLVPRQRWRLTFAFGLVHGFGFAAVLKDLGLGGGGLLSPLLGFNLGVELGQLGLVALFLPLAWWLRGTGFYQQVLLRGGSLLIALLALVWLVERAGDVVILGL
jgi:HupE / UreJ protein